MGIFDKFNTQNMGEADAFEKLCCQLFDNWGKNELCGQKDDWEYRKIRGAGGDGGIEAYWHSRDTDEWIGLQAKWFPKTMESGQIKQLTDSVRSAMSMRPNMTRYIVCVPHNLTSMKQAAGGKKTRGEDERWNEFIEKMRNQYPKLSIELWDEDGIERQLLCGGNEGCRRFWFSHSSINPETLDLSFKKSVDLVQRRYVPSLIVDGDMSTFLDRFYGTPMARVGEQHEIKKAFSLCGKINVQIQSLLEVNDVDAEISEYARRCQAELTNYGDWLTKLKETLETESLTDIKLTQFVIDYSAFDYFWNLLDEAKSQGQFQGHITELLTLLDHFYSETSSSDIFQRVRCAVGVRQCVIIGNQGTGKTCGIVAAAERYHNNRRHLPILISAASISEEQDWWQIIKHAVGVGDDWDESELWQALSSAAAIRDEIHDDNYIRGKVAIMVDGLDERHSPAFWERKMAEAAVISEQFPRIQFAYTTRPSGIKDKTSDLSDRICMYQLSRGGDVAVPALFDKYTDFYGINIKENKQARWMLKTPMELQLFCQVYQHQTIDSVIHVWLTELIKSEIKRLETEFATRCHLGDSLNNPVSSFLYSISSEFLDSQVGELTDDVFYNEAFGPRGFDCRTKRELIELLVKYGILTKRETESGETFKPNTVSYGIGARHLWDYYMAIRIMENKDKLSTHRKKDLLTQHPDIQNLYAILLIEKEGALPLDDEDLVAAVGKSRAYVITLDALSNACPSATSKFKQWVLDEMHSDKTTLSEIVNRIIFRVADISGHPLGAALLDEFLRSYDEKPAIRDEIWSVPSFQPNLSGDYRASLVREHELIKQLPRLDPTGAETSTQLPLVFAWGLSSLSNLRRQYFRNQLVFWAMHNPVELQKLFEHFCMIDDPQIREDVFAIAEEVIVQGKVPKKAEKEIGQITIKSVFAQPDKPDNRNAAVRHYGRILVERCISDGLLEKQEAANCRPPYDVASGEHLPIFPDACRATSNSGYRSMSYDLTRYVLVDQLLHTFDIRPIGDQWKQHQSITELIDDSASAAGIESPRFDGWVIAVAYQYLLDHGYSSDFSSRTVDTVGKNTLDIDTEIRKHFYAATHGQRSLVMTICEKYTWCALNEICGYLADRIPVEPGLAAELSENIDDNGLATDYSMLLSYDSPLFEASVTTRKEREEIDSPFPASFACKEPMKPLTKDELHFWIDSIDDNVVFQMLNFRPTCDLRIKSTIALSLFANDWGECGKESRIWLDAGVVSDETFDKLRHANQCQWENNSLEFHAGYITSGTYLSPVEIVASPWMKELMEPASIMVSKDNHILIKPLTGQAVANIPDIGDYDFTLPSSVARDCCEITGTDGFDFADSNGDVRFQYLRFGTPYRHEYKALMADRDQLLGALRKNGMTLVWFATVHRQANELVSERIPGFVDIADNNWIVWQDDDGTYHSCLARTK